MFHCLNEILDLCHNFCLLVSQNPGPLDDRGAAQLDIMVKVSPLGLRYHVQGCTKNVGQRKKFSQKSKQ